MPPRRKEKLRPTISAHLFDVNGNKSYTVVIYHWISHLWETLECAYDNIYMYVVILSIAVS